MEAEFPLHRSNESPVIMTLPLLMSHSTVDMMEVRAIGYLKKFNA
jgi:hypothetical protein